MLMYKKLLVTVEVVLIVGLFVYLVHPADDNSSQYYSEDTIATSLDYAEDEEVEIKTTLSLPKDEVDTKILPLETSPNDAKTYLVTRVIDGDTIEVEVNGEKKRVRYIGVDTPETVHPSKPVQCFGKEASDFNKKLVEGKWVRLEKDISEVDKYGRLLRYVFVGDEFVNFELVNSGYANVITYPPDIKYTELFLKSKREAQAEKRGLWGAECMTEADLIKYNSAPVIINPRDSSCVVKGNISADKEKIYHVPGCEYYDKTIISETYGERWFCTEEEAVEAGWRRALNCL